MRGLVRNLLSGNGYTVLEARTGSNGVQVAQDHAGEIDLLVADMLLPELSGFDLAQQLRSRFPRMKVLFMTGYVEGDIVQKCVGELGASFLDKPFQPAALVKKVREILDNAEGAASNG